MAKKTIFAGLQVLGANESIFTDNAAFTSRDREEIDRGLKIGIKTHRHDGSDGLLDPIATPSGEVIGSGGTIAGGLGISIGYTIQDGNGGETLLSPTTTVSTPGPLEVPLQAPVGVFSSAAGALLIDTFTYALTYTDGEGGETPVGPSVTIDRPPGFPNGQIELSGLAVGMAEAGAAGWRLFRARGGGQYVLLATGDESEDTFTDDGSIEPDCDTHPPTDNINTTNQINQLKITIPEDAIIQAATFINLYASLTGEFGESSFLAQYPVGSAGESVFFESLDFIEGQPPDVNRSYGGAPLIDPDVELLDWHWKRPVQKVADLPTEEEGAEEGDVRPILEAEEPTVYMFLNGEWQPLEFGGGGGSIAVAAVGQDFIYWVDTAKGSIGRSKHDGTEVTHDFITTPDEPIWGVVVDDEFIYWIDGSGNDTIGRARLDGSEATNDFITLGVAAISGIAVNDTHIYWANFQSDTIGRANIDGTSVNNSFLTTPENPSSLAMDDTFIYWSDGETTSIGRAKLDGSEPNQNWLTTPTDPIGVSVNDEFVFWLNESGDSIGRANIDGSEPNNTFMTGPAGDPIAIWADASFIYWTDWENDTVGRAKTDGTGATNTLVTGLSEPGGLTVGHSAEVNPAERLEFAGSGITDVDVEALGSGIARITIFTPGLDVTASGVTVLDALSLEFLGSGGVKVTETEPSADKALVKVEGPGALLANEGMGVIVHGSNAAKARGTSFKQYTWIGSVEPENMAEFDIWIETP